MPARKMLALSRDMKVSKDKLSQRVLAESAMIPKSELQPDPPARLKGHKTAAAIWKKIVNWACEGWKSTYEDENVTFDLWMFQHDYKNSGKEIVNIAVDRGIAEKDETGAVIARLKKYGLPDKVLLRSDGTSIYSTQDLQLAKDSFEKYNLDQRLYVVDSRQSDYFKQIFKILEILGFEWFSKHCC